MSESALLGKLGKQLSEAEDAAAPDPSALAPVRARVVAIALERSTRSRPEKAGQVSRGWVAALAAAAVLVFGLLAALKWRDSDLSYRVGANTAPLGVDLAAPLSEPLSIRFSDGSEVELQPDSRGRIAELGKEGAHVVLEKGSLTASVEHATSTRWTFSAGPVDVVVTGTRFDIAWDPRAQTFELVMREGSVRVEGACVGEARTLGAGDKLSLSCRSPTAAAPATSEPVVEAESDTPPVETAAPASSKPAPPDWEALAARGKYRDALAAAETAGFDSLCESMPASALLRLANVARLGGSGARSTQALTKLRERFPKSPEAAEAAFAFGRAAFDGKRSFAEAARWFETYLAERPNGPFAREALGRLLECRSSGGSKAAARSLAERYLALYPDGPHARLARQVLEAGPEAP